MPIASAVVIAFQDSVRQSKRRVWSSLSGPSKTVQAQVGHRCGLSFPTVWVQLRPVNRLPRPTVRAGAGAQQHGEWCTTVVSAYRCKQTCRATGAGLASDKSHMKGTAAASAAAAA